uniref:alpha-1,6-mannosyl-glycoprotein 6-beta-N-acetylglucosaminyltransferase n=1 Tax=Panagrellus redivivus TaxID=6233 RepID=A0A7E4ZTL0_PANRE
MPLSLLGKYIRIRWKSKRLPVLASACADFKLPPPDPAYPHCQAKLDWMGTSWNVDKCYAAYGVNGSLCSSYLYLSTVERHCPPLNRSVHRELSVQKTATPEAVTTDDLFAKMTDNPTNYAWMQDRITRLFPAWKKALTELLEAKEDLKTRKKLNVVFYLGFLSKETGLKFGEKSAQGGPLGELVQWSDLITSTYLLGHNLSIFSEYLVFKQFLSDHAFYAAACPTKPGDVIDVIFTDIIGLRKMRQRLKPFYTANKCRIRLLDSFGTHAEFNSATYYRKHFKDFGPKIKNPWGGHGLELGQFLTMYPHTDDNTFLGFVVETFEPSESEEKTVVREARTLIYGKEKYMWNETSAILETVRSFTEIDATVADAGDDFMKEKGVHNLGLLSGREFHVQLRKSKVFLGLGFPLEGPAPLEAISNGAIFINHRFDPPKSRLTWSFFADKPTLRKLASQNPYMERFVGAPLVITVDVFNQTELKAAYVQAMATENKPYLPREFSFIGMLERVDIILTRHDYCSSSGLAPAYPPWESAKIILASEGKSCQEACAAEQLICERTFFRKINNESYVQSLTNSCSHPVESQAIPYAPTSTCILQSDSQLFSCATEPPSDVRRICPCRTFKSGQIILCDRYC